MIELEHCGHPAHGRGRGGGVVAKAIGWLTAGAVVAATATAAVIFRPDLMVKVAAGMAAHNICSATFVAQLDPEATKRELVQPLIGAAGSLVTFRVDRARKRVETSFAWVGRARASFTPGYGCRIDFPENVPLSPLPDASPVYADDFAPSGVVTTTDTIIERAISGVFAEKRNTPIKDVKAVVVVKDGHVIAERYASGFGIDTPLLSYSVAKSFTNALIGVLVRQNRLRTDQVVAAPEWNANGDPRAKITVEDLLRMRSGLDAPETGSPSDPVAQMEFLHADMAGFAALHPLKRRVGAEWEYTSANTLILDRLIGQAVGGGPAGLRSFAEREIFKPAHMSRVTMEFDGAGTFVGSSYVYAPARSFARFGEIYVNDGVTREGQRILRENWVAWSRRSTLGKSYGAGFWTNDGTSKYAAQRVANGFPRDGFYASGVLGQRIYIVPSEHVVIARFGYSRPPDFGIDDDVTLIDAVIRATRDTSHARRLPL